MSTTFTEIVALVLHIYSVLMGNQLSKNVRRKVASSSGDFQGVETLDVLENKVDTFQLWKTDPVESFSDWRIEVKHSESGIVDQYHVHKSYLARGPQASTFFAQLFDDGSLLRSCETSTQDATTCNSCVLAMDDYVADSFPDLLDHIYSGDCRMVTSNATALYFLADYLVMPSLTAKLNAFLEQDLSWQTLHIYCHHANKVRQEHVLRMVASVFVEQIQKIEQSSPILNVMEPGMLLEVLLTLKDLKRSAELDFHISKLTMAYCRKHKELTPTQLHQLTDVL